MQSRPTGIFTRVEVFFNTKLGKEWSNIFWFKADGATPASEYVPDAQAIYDQLQTTLVDLTTTEVTVEGCVVVFNDGTGSYGVEVYQAHPGTVTATLIPEDVSAVVQRLTVTSGPSGRGRIFFAGLPETFVTGSYLSDVGATAFGAASADLQVDFPGASVTYSPFFFSPTTGYFARVQNFIPVALLATNRKRRPRF